MKRACPLLAPVILSSGLLAGNHALANQGEPPPSSAPASVEPPTIQALPAPPQPQPPVAVPAVPVTQPIARPGRSSIITGSVLLAVGALTLAGGVGALYAPVGNHDFRGVIFGLILIPSGIGLMIPGVIITSIGGYQNRKAAQTVSTRRVLPNLSLSPALSTTRVSLSLVGRF